MATDKSDTEYNEFYLRRVAYVLPEGKRVGFELDDTFKVVSMEENSIMKFKMCVYDQIHRINGRQPLSVVEAMERLSQTETEIRVSLYRSRFMAPIPYNRLSTIKQKRGFCYFLAIFPCNLFIGLHLSPHQDRYGLKHYVSKLERLGFAKKVLQEGDFLLDVDGHLGAHMNSSYEFERKIHHNIRTKGSCSVIVERAVDMEIKRYLMHEFGMLKMPETEDSDDLSVESDVEEIVHRRVGGNNNYRAPPPPQRPILRPSRVQETGALEEYDYAEMVVPNNNAPREDTRPQMVFAPEPVEHYIAGDKKKNVPEPEMLPSFQPSPPRQNARSLQRGGSALPRQNVRTLLQGGSAMFQRVVHRSSQPRQNDRYFLSESALEGHRQWNEQKKEEARAKSNKNPLFPKWPRRY